MNEIRRFQDDVMVSMGRYSEFMPIPPIQSRMKWNSVRGETRRCIIERAAHMVGYPWPALTSSDYRMFIETGNRATFETSYFLRRNALSTLVLAECMDANGRFIDEIINLIWMICEESSWVLPAHLIDSKDHPQLFPDVEAPTMDVCAAETGAILATALYLLRDKFKDVSPRIGRRIGMEVWRRVLEPFLYDGNFGFTGSRVPLNSWLPWFTCGCLTALLFTELDERVRWIGVSKSMELLNQYMAVMPEDGGCDEGAEHWNNGPGMLFDAIQLICYATCNRVNMFKIPKLRAMGDYIQQVHIDNAWFVNFADSSAMPNVEPDLLYRYGKYTNNDELMRLGVHLLHAQNGKQPTFDLREPSLLRQCWAVLNEPDMLRSDPRPPMSLQHYFPDIQLMTARSYPGTSSGFFVACKGGHNAERYNHNDVGNMVVYYDGVPVLIDVGVELYSRASFSSKRYEIWTMQSAYHNLPEIGGLQQLNGREYTARDPECSLANDQATFSLNIAGAYPKNCGCICWQRTVHLQRSEAPRVIIWDVADMDSLSGDLRLNFITYARPQLRSNAAVIGRAALTWDKPLNPTVTALNITDPRLKSVWSDTLYRITLTPIEPMPHPQLTFTLLPRAELD